MKKTYKTIGIVVSAIALIIAIVLFVQRQDLSSAIGVFTISATLIGFLIVKPKSKEAQISQQGNFGQNGNQAARDVNAANSNNTNSNNTNSNNTNSNNTNSNIGNTIDNRLVTVQGGSGPMSNITISNVGMIHTTEKLPYTSMSQIRSDNAQELKELIIQFADRKNLDVNNLNVIPIQNTAANNYLWDIIDLLRQSGLHVAGTGNAGPNNIMNKNHNGLFIDVMNNRIALIVGDLKD